MAMIYLVKDYENRSQLINFTMIRKNFEDFIWKHKILINQAVTNWGSGAKGYIRLSKLFAFIIDAFQENKSEKEILEMLDKHEDYNFFKAGVRELNPKKQKDFSTESKTEVFLREGVQMLLRCNICEGYLHKNSMVIDHDTEKENDGIGNADNGRLVHPYCNSVKKKLKQIGFITSF